MGQGLATAQTPTNPLLIKAVARETSRDSPEANRDGDVSSRKTP